MEKSLVLIKPDAMERELAGTILSRLQAAGMKLAAIRMLHLNRDMAERHYAIHREKPFFNDLVRYITSSPIVAAVFSSENAVDDIRKIMGPTDPAKAEPGTIRGDFGIDIEKNSVHGSDSPENAEQEIKLFFCQEEIFA